MEKRQGIYDTVTLMKEYNFHKPINISVIVEDNEQEPNQSKISDYGKYVSMSKSLQEHYQNINNEMQQQYSYIRNQPQNRNEISSMHKFSDNGNRNLGSNQRYVSSNNVVNTTSYTKHAHPCRESENTCSKAKSSFLYNSQKNEIYLINTVAENLALMMETYVHFCTLISKSKDQQYVTYLRAKCFRAKLNLFHKCLAVSKDFLLQHENNNRFIKTVLYKTKQISKVKLPSKHFENLYEDLLKWIRLKKSEKIKNYYQNTGHNENFAAHMHQPSNTVSKPISERRPEKTIFSSDSLGGKVTISVDPKILEQKRTTENVPNFTTKNQSYLQSKITDTHHFPDSNYLFINENYQQNKQSTMPNASAWSNSTYNGQLNPYEQNKSFSTRLTTNNQIHFQDVTRNSISRDSGFISPAMSVSPSEYYINNVQHPSAEYDEQRTLNVGMPNAITFEPNVAIEGPPHWNYF